MLEVRSKARRIPRRIRRILLIWLAGFVMPVLALDPSKTLTQYAHRIWGQEEGLFQPTIYAILQTSDGFLWLGTQDSLIRFDGAHFREFQKKDIAILHGALVRSLMEDSSGNVWAATIGNGVFRISPEGAVVRFTAPQALPSNNALCLDQGRDGSVWVCTDQGLVRFQAGLPVRITGKLPAGAVRATCETRDGTRWTAGPEFGLRSLSGQERQFEAVNSISTLRCGNDGALWAGTSAGVVRLTGKTITHINARSGLPDDAVSSLAESSDGSIWIGTDEGISRWRNGEINVYRTRDGLSHSVVLSLYFDREGTLWAGTKDGLDQFTNPKLTPYTTAEGLSSNEAGPVVADRAGRLWIGTLDAGLNVFDGRRFRRITQQDGLASNRILSLAAGIDGDLWVGTSNGLNHVVNGRVARLYAAGSSIRALFSDASGALWIGTSAGLFRRGANDELKPLNDQDTVVAIGEGSAQQILNSTASARLNYVSVKASGAYTLSGVTKPVDCYFIDRATKAVWMGTLGSGLLRLRNGSVARLHVRDGLWDNRIYAILRDGHDNFWFASSKGIFRIPAQQLEDFADGKIHAVNSIPFTTGQLRFECRAGVQPAAAQTKDGRLWFATTTGVVVVDPERLVDNPLPPPISITSLLIDGARREAGGALRLKPDERNVEIRYSGLSFVSPERVTFRYRLAGYDKNWTDAGTRREAFFTNLPPGQFRFQVLARSADGVWSRNAALLEFAVEPRLYQRAWFFPLIAGTLALLGLLVYRWRVRVMQRSFQIVLAERSRIARELHDTLLQGLSGITMQLQALWMRMPPSNDKRMLREIIEDAGQCSTEARQSLWGLRARESQVAYLGDKLAQLCREAIVHTPLQLELDIEPILVEGCPELEHQLLRIAREALLNAVKHAEADRVRVSLHRSRGFLELTITDDGKGFDTAVDYGDTGHFGVRGIQERVKELGATLSIKSDKTGTSVSVRVAAARTSIAAAKRACGTTHTEQRALTNDQQIRSLSVDDHDLVRKGLAAILAAEPGMTLVAEASTGSEAVRLFEDYRPDVTLMDLRLPGKSGVETTREIRHSFPDARVIALTSYDGDQDIYRALEAGVCGYLLKDMVHAEVIRAIRVVHSGKRYIPSEVTQSLDEFFPEVALTPREEQVLGLVARGLGNKEVGHILGTAAGTIKAQVQSILSKLQARDRTHAVTIAFRRGILHLHQNEMEPPCLEAKGSSQTARR